MIGVNCEVVGPTILSSLNMVLDVVSARELATTVSRLRVTTPGVHAQFSEAYYAVLPANLKDRIALWSSAMTPPYSSFGFDCSDYAMTMKGDVAKHRALVKEVPVGAPALPKSIPFAFGVAWGQHFIDGKMREHASNLYIISRSDKEDAELAPLFFEPLSLKVPVPRYYKARTQVNNVSLLVV